MIDFEKEKWLELRKKLIVKGCVDIEQFLGVRIPPRWNITIERLLDDKASCLHKSELERWYAKCVK